MGLPSVGFGNAPKYAPRWCRLPGLRLAKVTAAQGCRPPRAWMGDGGATPRRLALGGRGWTLFVPGRASTRDKPGTRKRRRGAVSRVSRVSRVKNVRVKGVGKTQAGKGVRGRGSASEPLYIYPGHSGHSGHSSGARLPLSRVCPECTPCPGQSLSVIVRCGQASLVTRASSSLSGKSRRNSSRSNPW